MSLLIYTIKKYFELFPQSMDVIILSSFRTVWLVVTTTIVNTVIILLLWWRLYNNMNDWMIISMIWTNKDTMAESDIFNLIAHKSLNYSVQKLSSYLGVYAYLKTFQHLLIFCQNRIGFLLSQPAPSEVSTILSRVQSWPCRTNRLCHSRTNDVCQLSPVQKPQKHESVCACVCVCRPGY